MSVICRGYRLFKSCLFWTPTISLDWCCFQLQPFLNLGHTNSSRSSSRHHHEMWFLKKKKKLRNSAGVSLFTHFYRISVGILVLRISGLIGLQQSRTHVHRIQSSLVQCWRLVSRGRKVHDKSKNIYIYIQNIYVRFKHIYNIVYKYDMFIAAYTLHIRLYSCIYNYFRYSRYISNILTHIISYMII